LGTLALMNIHAGKMNVIGGAVNVGGLQLHSTAITDENHDQRAVSYDHQCLTSLDGLHYSEHLERVC